MSHFKRDHDIDSSKWQDIIELVAEVLYHDGSLSKTERYIVIDMLEDASTKFINLSPESRKIFDRHDHLDATHVGNTRNPGFYICLDGHDFYYEPRHKKWIPCQWESSDLHKFNKITVEKK